MQVSVARKWHTWQIWWQTQARGQTERERERERDIIPPGYFLLPFLRCPWCFLFLFASHKVTAISRASDIHCQLFKGRQRRRLLENRNRSAAGKKKLSDWCVRVASRQCLCFALLSWTTPKFSPTILEFNNFLDDASTGERALHTVCYRKRFKLQHRNMQQHNSV